jgi:hypothetical protein
MPAKARSDFPENNLRIKKAVANKMAGVALFIQACPSPGNITDRSKAKNLGLRFSTYS